MERTAELVVLDDLLDSLDQTWTQLSERLVGLTVDEYLWEPVANCWTVRPEPDGGGSVDAHDTEADPAPVTTIAWRMWHIAVDCLDSYSHRLFDRTGAGLSGPAWVVEPAEAMSRLERAWRVFRGGLADGGSDRLFDLLGPSWGPYAESTVLALALHAQREVTHHGAELGLLRDLYRAGSA
ncbi:MAG: DinB family protein [Ilumatobacteraceae bacterium]